MSGISVEARRADGRVELRLRFDHPTETGTRADALGIRVPPWYIDLIEVLRDDQTLARLALSGRVSRNPVIALAADSLRPGDDIEVRWHDNRGDSGSRIVRIG